MKKKFTILLSVFYASIFAADLPSNGCLLEAKYLYDECIKRRNVSALKWEIDGSIENGCQLEVKKIKDQCLKQYNYQEGKDLPTLVPSLSISTLNTPRNAQSCTFKSLLERLYARTQSSTEQISIRKNYLASLETQNFSESILSLNKIEEKVMSWEENYTLLKNSLETLATPQVDNFIKILGYGSNQDIADPSINMTIDELMKLNLNERQNADDFIKQIEIIKLPLENLLISVQSEIDDRELLEKNKAKITETFSNTVKINTLKTINLADNFNLLLQNDAPTFSGTQSIDLYQMSEDDILEIVKNFHLLALVSGQTIHLLAERNQPSIAPSFSLSIAAEALYLAEEVKFRSDYVSNLKDFDECAKFNDLANPDNQQESHLIRNLLLGMQTSILAARLSESREILLEMNIWNHLFTNQEKNIREKKIRIFTALLKAADMLKAVASLKMQHARAWKKLIDLIEIRTQTCIGAISPTPAATLTPVLISVSNCPADANSILQKAQSLQREVDSYQTTAKNQLAFLETSVIKIKTQLSDAQTFGNVKIDTRVAANKSANSPWQLVFQYLNRLKINMIKNFLGINSVFAAKPVVENIDLALGITDGSRYQSFFNLTKQTHKNIMLGQNKSYPDYEMSDLLKRGNYLSFISLFSLSAYKDMVKRTYARMISNSEKDAEILAAINHDSFKGFSNDLENQYQKTLYSLMPEMEMIRQSLKSASSSLPTTSYFSSQIAKTLRKKRNTEISKVEPSTKQIGENIFNKSNDYNDQNIQPVSNQILEMTLAIVDNLNQNKNSLSTLELSLIDTIQNKTTFLKQSFNTGLTNNQTTKIFKQTTALSPQKIQVTKPQVKTPVVALGNITPNKIITSLKDTVSKPPVAPVKTQDHDIFYKTYEQTKASRHEQNETVQTTSQPSLWEIISNTYMKVVYPQLGEENPSP